MRVLVVDDHAIVRAGLRQLFTALPRAQVEEAASGEEALRLLHETDTALVVLDLNLPGVAGFELLRRMLREQPGLRVLVLSMHTEALYASRALEAGALGYVSKSAPPDELLKAARRAIAGARYIEAEIAQELALQTVLGGANAHALRVRDLEILRLLAEGRSHAEIAGSLHLSYKTVANACTQLKARLGVTRMADLVRLAIGLRG